MKRWVVVLCLLAFSIAAFGFPQYAFLDVPSAIVHEDPWRTSFGFGIDEAGWLASITRTLSSRLEISMTAAAGAPFDLEGRLLVVKDLLPIHVAVGCGIGRVSLLATIFLGPVHLDAGRVWGAGSSRWGAIQVSPHPFLSLILGLIENEGRVGPIAGVRLYPGKTGLWGLSLLLRGSRIQVGVGGTV